MVLTDWVVAFFSVVWLLFIVTVPWDAHFKAREILDEAEISKRKEILVIESSLEYARKVSRYSFYIAISLHITSAIALYFIAKTGISTMGYYASILAVLFTFLRPSVRFYEYLYLRLGQIREEFRFPREDIREVLNDIQSIKEEIKSIEQRFESELGNDPKESSWKKEINSELRKISKTMEEISSSQTSLSNRAIENSKLLESVKTIADFLRGK
jgi:methyl-accepting chemotaxis protein